MTAAPHTPSPEFQHFLKLAHAGTPRRASLLTERKCRLVADALLETVPDLDGQAVAGLIEFIGLIKGNYQTLREMLTTP